jgi:hypothetical protein
LNVGTLALLLAVISGARGENPYAAPVNKFETMLHAAQFGEPGADRALERWLTAHAELAPAQRLRALKQLCGDYGVLTWNRPRVSVCAQEAALKARLGQSEEGDDDEGMAAALSDQPPIRAIGSGRVPLIWNNFGSQSTDVTVGGVTSSWFVDTGAEITVVTESLATRMKVSDVADRIRVGTTTSDVLGKVGVIDRLTIGSASAENVPVLILPDEQLKIGNVHQIDGILGLPVMVAFGRLAWVDGGRALALGEAAPKARASAPKIYWHEEGLGVPVSTSRGIIGAHLDTGANTTDWRQEGIALLDPSLIAHAAEETAHVGGAGGVVEVKQKRLEKIAFRLGPVPVRLEKVSLNAPGPLSAARIGMDGVSQFGVFILDFEQMRIDGRLKTAAERKASRQKELTAADVELQSKPK